MRVQLLVAALAVSVTPAVAQTLELPARNFNLEQCLQAALAKYPGQVKSAELEVEAGVPHYEFKIKTLVDGKEWEVDCNANTGAIGEVERDVERDDPAFKGVARIGVREALDAVAAQYPGMPMEVEFEVSPEGGAWYEITILQKNHRSIEVMVDAVSGRILGAKDEGNELEIFAIGED